MEKIQRLDDYEVKPKSKFSFNPFGLTEIQYLRGLVLADQINNDYENDSTTVDRRTTVYDFTEGILKKLDGLENE